VPLPPSPPQYASHIAVISTIADLLRTPVDIGVLVVPPGPHGFQESVYVICVLVKCTPCLAWHISFPRHIPENYDSWCSRCLSAFLS